MTPLWLAPGVSIDDVEAGLVTTCTWLNIRRVEVLTGTIERARVYRSPVDGGVEVVIEAIAEASQSKRTFRAGGPSVGVRLPRPGPFKFITPHGAPMCGRFVLYIGARLTADDVAHAAGGVAGPGYHRQVLAYVPRFALVAASWTFKRSVLGEVAARARELAYPLLDDDDDYDPDEALR